MLDLAEDIFLADFTSALGGNVTGLENWWSDPERGAAGLSVYRNTIAKGLSDALAANFPTVLAVVGADWMMAAARLHAQGHPPTKPPLIDYGADFPDWLARFGPASDMPYLADLARLDRMWTLAHLAADTQTLAPEALAALAPEDFESTTARLRPDVQFAGFTTGVSDLWRSLCTQNAPEAFDLSPNPQAIAVHRPQDTVETFDLCPAGLAFLERCGDGASLAMAAQAALVANPNADLGEVFARLIGAGVFAELIATPTEDEPDV